VPQQLRGEANSARLADLSGELASARNSLNALAPDVRGENEPRLQTFVTQWQKYLADSSSTVNDSLNQWITEAERQSEQP